MRPCGHGLALRFKARVSMPLGMICGPACCFHCICPIDSKLESWKAGKLESWKAGHVKTTIDLPEDLVKEMKFRAVREGRKLRDVAEEVFRRGLAATATPVRPGGRHRVKLPLIPAPVGAAPFALSGERLLELETEAEMGNPGA